MQGDIQIVYVNRAKGVTARLRIDSEKHDSMRVNAMVARLLFPDADPKAPDPVFDRIIKAQDAKRPAARK